MRAFAGVKWDPGERGSAKTKAARHSQIRHTNVSDTPAVRDRGTGTFGSNRGFHADRRQSFGGPTEWRNPMLTKALAASALMLGLATSAMAQSSDVYTVHARHHHISHRHIIPIDPYATGGIYSGGIDLNSPGNQGALGPCASDSPGPDANANMNVNDQYCGK